MCRDRNHASARRRRQLAAESGLCVDCGATALGEFKCCGECLGYRAQQMAMRRADLKRTLAGYVASVDKGLMKMRRVA
jgi:formylmethanofuran dehydrogenase subunit E